MFVQKTLLYVGRVAHQACVRCASVTYHDASFISECACSMIGSVYCCCCCCCLKWILAFGRPARSRGEGSSLSLEQIVFHMKTRMLFVTSKAYPLHFFKIPQTSSSSAHDHSCLVRAQVGSSTVRFHGSFVDIWRHWRCAGGRQHAGGRNSRCHRRYGAARL